MKLFLDVGGTHIRISISKDNTLGDVIVDSTPQKFEDGIDEISEKAKVLLAGIKPDKVVMGIAGVLNRDKSSLLVSPNLNGWVGKPLKDKMSELFGCSVYLQNDADLAGLGESVYGAGNDFKIVAYLTIGTGVGGTRIVNKKIDKSVFGLEPGHQILLIDGKPRSLESLVSGKSMEFIYGKRAQDITDDRVWDAVARYLAVAINNICVFWSPNIVILGGAVARSELFPFGKIKAYLNEFLTIFPSPPLIKISALGDAATLYGALYFSSLTGN